MLPQNDKFILLPSFDEVAVNKTAYAAAFNAQYLEQDPSAGKTLLQYHSERVLIQNPPQKPMTTKEMDAVYALPYERTWHPMYAAAGGVPSIEEVKFSITSQRGCFGGCHFCAITLHQGRIIQHRSPQSIVEEAKRISFDPEFKGYIHDVGGPTANFYNAACDKQIKGGVCRNRACLTPKMCPQLKVDHTDYMEVLKKVRAVDGVKKVFIRSGIRFDYVMADRKSGFLKELCKNHISGQLKVAPEHICDNVLAAMGKPGHAEYEEFKEAYLDMNKRLDKNQFLVPYLISGHPGCTLNNAIDLAVDIKKNRVMPEQVQDFYPTPGTISTTMYHTGIDPITFAPVYIPDEREKVMQRALLQFSKPENRAVVERALAISKRQDLVGYGPDCLLSPYRAKRNKKTASNQDIITSGQDDGMSAAADNKASSPRNQDNRPAASQNRYARNRTNAPAAANKDTGISRPKGTGTAGKPDAHTGARKADVLSKDEYLKVKEARIKQKKYDRTTTLRSKTEKDKKDTGSRNNDLKRRK